MNALRTVGLTGLLVFGLAITAPAAEPAGQVPRDKLSAMGFGAAAPLSDNQGLNVRGKGTRAIVWGTGYGVIVRPHFAVGAGPGTSTGGFSGGLSIGFAR